jgi:hypothetical protein
VHPVDLRGEFLISDSTSTQRTDPRRVVGGRGDLQHPADRLDPEPVPIGVDVTAYFLRWRSSSAPKKAAAVFKISFARRNSLFSRSSSAIQERSTRDQPGRLPVSTSCSSTHRSQRLAIDRQLCRHRRHTAIDDASLLTPLPNQTHSPLAKLIRIHPRSSQTPSSLHRIEPPWNPGRFSLRRVAVRGRGLWGARSVRGDPAHSRAERCRIGRFRRTRRGWRGRPPWLAGAATPRTALTGRRRSTSHRALRDGGRLERPSRRRVRIVTESETQWRSSSMAVEFGSLARATSGQGAGPPPPAMSNQT